MKKYLLLTALSTAIVLSSCSHRIYNSQVLQGNYELRMDSPSELEIKSKVQVFLSENDVKGDYETISINLYKPAFSIPLLYSQKAQVKKKFFEKAVKKAYELGGNGVIITAGGFYKVISIYNWDSDNAKASTYVNSILNTKLLDIFTSGKITSLSPREVKRYVEDLRNEIGFNLKTIKTSQEAKVVGQKIEALMAWNNAQTKLNKKLDKELKAYKEVQRARLKRAEKKEAKN